MKLFLNVGCEVEKGKDPKLKVLMVNPERLARVSFYDIWRRISSSFGKCEVEEWIAEEIISIAEEAAAKKEKFADFSEVSQSIYFREGKVELTRKQFKNIFCSLPIFRIIKEAEDVIVLEYIPTVK